MPRKADRHRPQIGGVKWLTCALTYAVSSLPWQGIAHVARFIAIQACATNATVGVGHPYASAQQRMFRS